MDVKYLNLKLADNSYSKILNINVKSKKYLTLIPCTPNTYNINLSFIITDKKGTTLKEYKNLVEYIFKKTYGIKSLILEMFCDKKNLNITYYEPDYQNQKKDIVISDMYENNFDFKIDEEFHSDDKFLNGDELQDFETSTLKFDDKLTNPKEKIEKKKIKKPKIKFAFKSRSKKEATSPIDKLKMVKPVISKPTKPARGKVNNYKFRKSLMLVFLFLAVLSLSLFFINEYSQIFNYFFNIDFFLRIFK